MRETTPDQSPSDDRSVHGSDEEAQVIVVGAG